MWVSIDAATKAKSPLCVCVGTCVQCVSFLGGRFGVEVVVWIHEEELKRKRRVLAVLKRVEKKK